MDDSNNISDGVITEKYWDRIGQDKFKAKIDGAIVNFKDNLNYTLRRYYLKDTILILKLNPIGSLRKYNIGSTLPNRIIKEEILYD